MITAKIVRTLHIDLGNGKPIVASYLGRGQFAEAWDYMEGRTRYVLMLVKDCKMKEALALWAPKKKHIPRVEHLGSLTSSSAFGNESEKEVYRMPWYEKLSAVNHPEAWAQYKILFQAREDAWREVCNKKTTRSITNHGTEICHRTVELVTGKVPKSLSDALYEIADAGANYGSSICMEFAPRNLSVDKKGNLVLRDILFDLELVQRRG
jgi:hypothetical protein